MSCSTFFYSFFVTVIVKCTPVINYKVKQYVDGEFCTFFLLLACWKENCLKEYNNLHYKATLCIFSHNRNNNKSNRTSTSSMQIKQMADCLQMPTTLKYLKHKHVIKNGKESLWIESKWDQVLYVNFYKLLNSRHNNSIRCVVL